MAVSIRPTMFAPCSVKTMSDPSQISVWGSRASGSGISYRVISPVSGSSRPMCRSRFPAYQTVPFSATIRLWGPAPSGRSYRVNSPVSGSRYAA